jgi:cyanophycinase-like exopeptidase
MESGPIALVGSGEFLSGMVEVDAYLLGLLARERPRVAIVPTAAAEEGPASVDRWAQLGIVHFQGLGAEPVPVLIGDRDEANDPDRARALADSDLIYFSGGDPAYLVQTLADTAAMTAIKGVHAAGAALAGCSAGAMALAGSTLHWRASRTGPASWLPGWGIVPALGVLPHFDRMLRNRSEWVDTLVAAAPAGVTVVGIEEHTALLGVDDEWRVFGAGGVHVYAAGSSRAYVAGQTVPLLARG